MPCPVTGPKMFCEGPNFLSQLKNLTAFMPCPFIGPKMFCAGPIFCARPKNYLHIVLEKKKKDDLHSVKLF